MEPFEFMLTMLAVGVGVGVLSAALGVGGGILMVPAFVYVFREMDMDMNTAKGSSLLVIMFVAAFNSWRMNRGAMKNPWGVVGAIAAGSIVGGYGGGWLSSLMSDTGVTWVFIGLIAFAAIRTFFLAPRTVHEDEVRRRRAGSALIGLASGVVAGATGTGGGAILVPLALWAGVVSNERVVALSNTVMAATAFAGMLAHLGAERTVDMAWTFGLVNVALAPLVIVAAVPGAWLGRWLNRHLSLDRRRVVMSLLLILIAARLLYRVLA